MKKIRIGVAGLGFIGPIHIEALRRIPGLEVVSVHHHNDAVQTKAEQLGIERYYQDYDAFLSSDRLDCVHICTPNFLHYEMAREALAQGLHVVCEKPLATKISEAEELVALAKSTHRVNAVQFNVRYYPLIRQMKTMREKGELGAIHTVLGSYLQDWLFYETDYNWRLEPKKSGESRAIADIGSHLMDLLEYITGLKITAVMADFDTVHKTRKKPLVPVETYSGKLLKPEDYADVPIATEDTAHVLLRFNNGHKGSITVSQVAAGRKNRVALEISAAKLSLAWESEKPNELWIGKRDETNGLLLRDPSLFHAEANKITSFPGGHNEGFADTSKQLFSEVYNAIRTGIPQSEWKFPDFGDGLRELVLAEAIIASNKQQAWITVP
ncbi:Gfo/Idh/MocA family protein [Ulvibacterium marinum]|uniref:Gfo/Idh/MocA family oxidoreductase n=1 Tax=Ulvibacterium marinum TaxID=2419782 RepID=A0A3B0C7P2_9FLAO|nr:Gfo/Idh/MocA family oxidoreductase [Ulvibacterium marinum]RKN81220.1 gfo/Idh/MocA family oxidoreductase [Ulvibacterium marinum]